MKALKGIIAVAAIAAAAWFVMGQLEQRKLIEKQNEAVALHSKGKYKEAVKIYKEILPKIKKDSVQQVKVNLAKSYQAISDTPGLSEKKKLAYCKAALKYDPKCITDPKILAKLKK